MLDTGGFLNGAGYLFSALYKEFPHQKFQGFIKVNLRMDKVIKKAFPVLMLSIFASMLGIGIVVPLLPLYAEEMGASGIWIGMIFAGFSISRTTVMPIAGKISDRRGRKIFLSFAMFSYAILSLGYIMARNTYELTFVRFIHGIPAGMLIPIAQAYVGDLSPEEEEGRWQGYFNASFFGGFGCGPLMGGVLTDHFGMDTAFIAMGGLNMLGFLLVTLFLPEPDLIKKRGSVNPSFRDIGKSNIIKGLVGFRLAFSIGRGIFAGFLPVFGGIYIGLSATQIGILVAANILIMSMLQPLGGIVADKWNRNALVIIGSVLNIFFLGLIPFGRNFYELLLICFLGSLGGSISMPSASAMIVEEGRKFGMGSTMAIFGMVFSVGMGIGPLFGGLIVDTISVTAVFYTGAMMGVLGVLILLLFIHAEHTAKSRIM